MREVTVGGLMVLIAATGLGTLAIFGKFAEATGLSRPTLLFFRFSIGAAIVWGVLLVRNDLTVLSGRPLYATVVLGLLYAALTLAYFRGLAFMTASLTAIVFYTYPIFVFGLSVPLLEEQVTRTALGALGLALAGVVMVVGLDASQVSLLGILLVTSAAAGYGIYNVAGRILVADTDPTHLTAHVLVVTAATIGLVWARAGFHPPQGPTHWGIVLGIGVLGTGMPLLLLYEGLTRIEATHASILGTAEPVATVLLGVTILGESLTLRTVLGAVLILGGVTLVQTTRRHRRWLLAKIGLH
ncbi:multidrug DMT transporter permease [Halodesulfurarchaeum formicicum]|uniref:Multidrug DMT transporter permease n=1 Tax=Halodesulfurarchaeum formicicum TaxID=1873524 RepID=A0A1D8S639_9EURY|nr:DMT family transporter [Halodesulfurarchaeum formicicum]AOW80803.1 multidrug DMT transporter permease [Halodesulfurarchaeum formicicum]APE96139.1 multidrug DMT transporter permease [Halodesulfurarchaeum formicicum]